MLAGGLLVALVGLSMFRRKPIKTLKVADTTKAKAVKYALQAAGCALANPGAMAYNPACFCRCPYLVVLAGLRRQQDEKLF